MPRFTRGQLDSIYRRSDEKCLHCGQGFRRDQYGGHHNQWNVDHIVPRSLGGPDWVDNLAVSCVPCNQSKGNKFTSIDFRNLTRHIRRKPFGGVQRGGPRDPRYGGNPGGNRGGSRRSNQVGRGGHPQGGSGGRGVRTRTGGESDGDAWGSYWLRMLSAGACAVAVVLLVDMVDSLIPALLGLEVPLVVVSLAVGFFLPEVSRWVSRSS